MVEPRTGREGRAAEVESGPTPGAPPQKRVQASERKGEKKKKKNRVTIPRLAATVWLRHEFQIGQGTTLEWRRLKKKKQDDIDLQMFLIRLSESDGAVGDRPTV